MREHSYQSEKKAHSLKPDPFAHDRQSTPLARPCPTTVCRVGKARAQHPQPAGDRIDQPLGPRGMAYRRAITAGTIIGDIKAS